MSFLGNPKLLYFTRLAQLILAILFLVLICYSGANRGWWSNIDGPLALGVIASIFTFAVTIHTMYFPHLLLRRHALVDPCQFYTPPIKPLLRRQCHLYHRSYRCRSRRLSPLGCICRLNVKVSRRVQRQGQ